MNNTVGLIGLYLPSLGLDSERRRRPSKGGSASRGRFLEAERSWFQVHWSHHWGCHWFWCALSLPLSLLLWCFCFFCCSCVRALQPKCSTAIIPKGGKLEWTRVMSLMTRGGPYVVHVWIWYYKRYRNCEPSAFSFGWANSTSQNPLPRLIWWHVGWSFERGLENP